jgi:hypothetical protein
MAARARLIGVLLPVLMALAAPAMAEGVIRPLPRPEGLAPAPVAAPKVIFAGAAPARSVRPPRRPVTVMLVAPPPAEPRVTQVQPTAMTSPRPVPRPRDLAAPRPAQGVTLAAAAGVRVEPGRELVRPKKGALCGDPALRGERLAPITGKVRGCGIEDPVRVTEVDGVRLSTPATLDCATARALREWVETGLKPAVGRAGVAEIKVAAHYTCRTRNNRPGAPISEHGRGKAIDIAGIRLGNGTLVTVLGDYRGSKVLQKARRAACGIFGTTLGPGSDRFHNDHLHFDTARHRNGPYCR